jgi:transglutaminase-like putative cysteine protease
MRRLRIDHSTDYVFGAPVTLLPHRLMLRPRGSHVVRIASSTIEIEPPAILRWQRDALDNSVAVASFAEPALKLSIASSVTIEHYEEAPLDFLVDEHAVRYPFAYLADEASLLAPFRTRLWANDGGAVDAWLAQLGSHERPLQTFTLLDRMNRAIQVGFRYQAREEAGVQPPAHTLALGAGSCRDFAALFMEACRALGLASRFVSGYLHGPISELGDGATHAWCEVYLPGPGWKGFDPSTGEVTGDSHIAVAVAQHPERVPPVAGSFRGAAGERPTMLVGVRVQDLGSS